MVARWQRSALTLSLVLIGLLAGIGAVENQPEWAGYQRAYARLAASLNGVRAASEFRPEIQQIEIAALNRVDRCTTCHLGVANSRMAGAPEPFTAHSPLVATHPPEDFGCTICHGGEGRAVALAEAHGEIPGQPRRLTPAALRPSACYACHGLGTLPAADTAIAAEGIKLINEYKCLRCHQLDGIGQRSRPQGGSIGPDLSAIASQRSWVELYAHLLKPDALVPGSTMPDFGLRRSEATAITAFLLTRLNTRDHVSDVSYLTTEPVLITPTPAPRRPRAENRRGAVAAPIGRGAVAVPVGSADKEEKPAPNYDGRKLFEGLECSVCHRVGLTGGEVGPALSHIGRARDAAWLRNLLTDPARVFPNGQMPAYDLSEAQLVALVGYLTSLK